MSAPQISLVYSAVADLKHAERNPRTHSPEQIRQKYPSTCSDMYGFGCMLFEMLAGKPPFTANTPPSVT